MIEIRPGLSIPAHELSFEFSTASGPGGQHVNRTQTRVTLVFDLEASESFTLRQKRRLRERLASRLDRSGRIRLACGKHRSQGANKEEVLRRFAALLRQALLPRKKRVSTTPSAAEKRRRLETKRRRGRIKQLRRQDPDDD